MNIYPAYIFKIQLKSWKPNHSFNDSKPSRIKLWNFLHYWEEWTQKTMTILIVWIVLIPSKQNTNLNRIKKYVKNADFCSVEMPSEEDTKVLEFN